MHSSHDPKKIKVQITKKEYISYYENGDIKEQEIYKDGKVIERKEY